MSNNLLLLDADVFCHQFAYSHQQQFDWDDDGDILTITHPEQAEIHLRQFVDQLTSKLKANEVWFILSDRKENFRKTLEPTYKAGRYKKTSRPELWYHLRDYIENGNHGYRVECFPRLEGDDVLGFYATNPKFAKRAIMVSIDKDMNTVPGRLYLYNKPELGVVTTSPQDAHRFHMTQTLTGDAVDEFKGCPGVGPKRAEKALDGIEDPFELWEKVVDLYEAKGLTEDDAIHQARLARILHWRDYKRGKIRLWSPNVIREVK